ncbi:MAG: nucleotidyltransferase family protein [Thermomicrobiales bacterium]
MRNHVALSPASTREIPTTISAEFLQALRDHGVIQAQLFGSSAVGAVGPESDIDLLVTFAEPVPLFAQLRLADLLQRICGRPVDLMTDIHPAFAPLITPTLIPLPL